jgi:hypothetical protein
MEHAGPVRSDGSLTEAAIILLHAVGGVDLGLLRAVRIRPSRTNWLHAPWYRYRRGGAITVGRRIWVTRIWSDPKSHGDGSLRSTWIWLLLLAHETGHLPQAERFGQSPVGKARYVAAFAWEYAVRAVLFRHPIHDGSRLEREADLGRRILLQLIGKAGETHPVVSAVQANNAEAVRAWADAEARHIAILCKAPRK